MNRADTDLQERRSLLAHELHGRAGTHPGLLAALGRLARGLSALFWGLPLTLVICVQSATGDWLRPLGILPALAVSSLLFYGLLQLGHFQPQERLWQRALDRAKVLALLTLGLAPFLYWWNQFPQHPFFFAMMVLAAVSGLLLLFALNPVLLRLSAMLPDETLRQETRAFTLLNRLLLIATVLLVGLYQLLAMLDIFPNPHSPLGMIRERASLWFVLFLVLMPMAMTMALIWKTKEVILSSVFGGEA